MSPELIEEAKKLGINYSLYYLLTAQNRDRALRADIDKEKERRKECGKN